ncbi:MAG TPA: ribonuclease J [Clostridia bacterium]|nr:ribonuclease J [Clostridia bacterium]HOL60640.1 ribonuclease J [Clostridia bacterium]HPO53047.1 ribonuclease J [Clostridia bacterium]
MAKKLKIIFLGGVGEIGKNMTAIEYNNNIIVVDSGLSFPNIDEMPGIDYVIPDYSYLVQNQSKIRGILITHGHEDHIGALPYVLQDIQAPVYGSAFSIALLQHKLREHKVKEVKTHTVDDNNKVFDIGCFRAEFVRVTHSIAGAYAISITTPKGVIFFTGDYKIDYTPVDGRAIDLARIAEIGKEGVLLMLQDSTNVERQGYSMSERSVGQKLDDIFYQNIHKRIIVATFSTNIHRVQQIINCCIKYNRRIAFSGRSMINIAEIAHKLKELHYPKDMIVDLARINSVPYDKICIISTGTQGEPESALTRMSKDELKKITISDTDCVVFSSSPIPGNEKMIYNVINNLCKKGADVIYKDLSEVHVSGHACREELKTMISLVKPRYFIPVHGEYRHLKQHVDLAETLGVPRDNMLIPEIGDVIEVSKGGLRKEEKLNISCIMLDGSFVESSDMILRDRKTLSEDGFVIVILNISASGNLDGEPYFETRGITVSKDIEEKIKNKIMLSFSAGDFREMAGAEIRSLIRKSVAKELDKKLKKHPVILPIIFEH